MYRNRSGVASMRFFFTISFVFFNVALFSQIQQPDRFEIELNTFEDSYNVLAGEDNGVILYKPLGIFHSGSELWRFIKLDTALNQQWAKEYYFDRGHIYKGYEYHNNSYYFLFQLTEHGTQDLLLIQMNEFTGDTLQHEIKNVVRLELKAFEMSNNAALIGGYFNQEPVVMYYGLSTKKTKVLPGIFGSKTELVQVNVKNDQIKVLVTARTLDNRNTLAIKTYDWQGNYIDNYTFNPEGDIGLIYGRVAEVGNEGSIVSGTYGVRRSEYSRGLFIAQHKIGEKEVMKYFNFADLENFFTYMKAKRQTRVSNKISRKKVKGKKIKFNYRLLVHEIIETDEEYIMLGEAFYPKYTSNYSSYMYSPLTSSFAGYKYTHAVVIGFDRNGNKLWDNSFQIEDVLSYTLDQYVHADVIDDKVVLLYLYNDEIRTKTICGSEVLEGKYLNSVQMMFADDVVNKSQVSNIGGLEKWYGHNFLAYGVQKIKNLRDSGVKLNRRVFYINKLFYTDNKTESQDLSE